MPVDEMTKSDRDLPFHSKSVHAVRFYEDGQALARIVAGFITEGWLAGDPAIIIATPEHRHRILQSVALSVDVKRLMARGDLIALDAHEALRILMVDGMPAVKPFEETILPMIDKLANGRKNGVVRVYGEMVDVLWQRGQEAAAIGLEMLGSQLASMRNVSILCGYSMSNSYKESSFERICREHTHVVSADGVASEIGPGGVI